MFLKLEEKSGIQEIGIGNLEMGSPAGSFYADVTRRPHESKRRPCLARVGSGFEVVLHRQS